MSENLRFPASELVTSTSRCATPFRVGGPGDRDATSHGVLCGYSGGLSVGRTTDSDTRIRQRRSSKSFQLGDRRGADLRAQYR